VENDIERIVWNARHQRMEVEFVWGAARRVVADALVAETLARHAGLIAQPCEPGVSVWTRGPGTGRVA
jgi:hypothetical protein